MNRLIQISLFASLLAACSTGESTSGNVLGRFEGSFDAVTGKMTITMLDEQPTSQPGLSPQAVLPYGTGAGQAYLHTGGVGDAFVNPPFSPPTFGNPNLFAQVFFQNGTGGAITSPKVFWDSTTPGTIPITTDAQGTCTNVPAPCMQVLGSAMPLGGFPTPDTASAPGARMIFDTTTTGGGNFTFAGHLED